MKTILVASTNPVKVAATLKGFQEMFPDETFEISGESYDSGVADQPINDAETLQGAKTRAINASQTGTAEYYVGIEGGIEDKDYAMEAFSWVVVRSGDGTTGMGRTGTFFLPPPIAALIRQGKGLGEADDIVFGRTNSKQKNGAVGLLTGDTITRSSFCTTAVILALIPFKNPTLY